MPKYYLGNRGNTGAVVPVLESRDEEAPESVVRSVLGDLEAFYSPMRSEDNLGLEFEGARAPVRTRRGEGPLTWFNEVHNTLTEKLHAKVNIQHIGRRFDSGVHPGRWQHGFAVYFNVLNGDGREVEDLGSQARDDFLDYMRNERQCL